VEPCQETFNLRPSPIASKRSTVLSCRKGAIGAMGSNYFDPSLSKSSIETVTVKRKFPNKSLRFGLSAAWGVSVLDKGDFMRASRSPLDDDGRSEPSATAISFIPLPGSVLPHQSLPLFRHHKRCIDEASANLILPRVFRSCTRLSKTCRKPYDCTNSW